MSERRAAHDHKDGCVFCTIPLEQRQDLGVPSFYGSFDAFPVSPGHMEIVPTRHVVDSMDLTEREWTDLSKARKSAREIIESTNLTVVYRRLMEDPLNDNSVSLLQFALKNPNIVLPPKDYNEGFNDGRAAGRTVDHFHWHVIPRYESDVEDPRGGIRYVIPNLANYKVPRK
jgi:diadenosine tetraphosphate (Ap4A) HIT family hydrolase